MTQPLISVIAAIGSNRELGKNNKLLWHIPEDLKRFKELTWGHPVIMGRKTFESIGKPLPGRNNIVVSRKREVIPIPECKAKSIPECNSFTHRVCNSLEEAIKLAKQYDQKEIFIIGGGEIYQQAINLADKLYLTIVKGKYNADTFFPDYSQFKKVIFQKKNTSDKYVFTFLELVR